MASPPSRQQYHHGDLRAALIAAALEEIAAHGTSGLSLRALARRVGVSNAAPVHHFGDKAGLLSAVAAEGWQGLAEALTSTWTRTGSMLEVGVAYVGFATSHRAYFEVMHRPDTHRPGDPTVRAARKAASTALDEAARTVADAAGGDRSRAGLAGWALMHGVAALWLSGGLPAAAQGDPEALARQLGSLLFQDSSTGR